MFFRLFVFFGLCFLLSPCSSLAQSAEPVVTPWSVENTASQARIRQYENFRSLQTTPLTQITANDAEPFVPSAPNTEDTPPPLHPPFTDTAETPFPTAPHQTTNQTPSVLEALYAKRIGTMVPQFGYDLFGVPSESLRATLDNVAEHSPSIPSGAVQDNFILNTGDALEILFTGQRTDRGQYTVNGEGLLLITDFPPIPAAGRSIGQVRISIEAAARNLYNTIPHVSLSAVRQIDVLIAGHVKRPGRQTLTVFYTVLDALMETGGVQKTGSLRQIKLIRGGQSRTIDLYDLLLRGGGDMDLQLRDGDRIIVPAIGPTLAIAGEAKRRGIYEIRNNETLTLNQMLVLGGNVLAPGQNRFLKLAVTPQGQELLQDVTHVTKPVFGDGALLLIEKGTEKRAGTVELKGHTRRPGLYARDENKTLANLLSSSDILGPDIYPLIGVIDRWDEEHLSRTMLDFAPHLILKGGTDIPLKDGDTVTLFSQADIQALSPTDSVTEPSDFAAYLKERSVFIRGAVRHAGAYPIAHGVSLDALLAVTGGLTIEADPTRVEVTALQKTKEPQRREINLNKTQAKTVLLSAGDSVRVNEQFQKIADHSVMILGEVKNPGRYDLIAGDKISALLKRAGGLTAQAYPLGAIFSRETERKAEEARFHAQARAMEQAIAGALQASDEKINAEKIAEARELAAELREAKGLGRITIEANPEKLAADPALDLLLEPGDRLFIPKRNLTVRVSGEVLSPASLQFREDKTASDYIREAGDFTYNADQDRAFVLYPNGAAQPLAVSSWNFDPVKIPPGSTVIVPRDPKPFDFIQSARDVSQILSNLAVSAIFVDDLKSN